MHKRTFLRAALSGLSLISLTIRTQMNTAALAVLPDAAVWALGLWALWQLYGAFEKQKTPARLWVLSAVFAGVMTLGQSFAALGTAEWVTGHKLEALLFFAGRVPLYCAGMQLLLRALARPGKQVHLSAVRFGGLLLLCWLPWYVCLFPGTVSTDSVSQLKIILGLMPMSNANPICQTGLVAAFRWLGETLGGGPDLAVALYCITQAVLMAWLLGTLLHLMGRSAAPRWLVWGSFAFYAFCPVFPVFAFCVGKDTNFAMAVLFLSIEVWRALHEENPKPIRWVCMGVAAVCCVVLRNAGVYLALITLAVVCLCRRRGTIPACGLACAVGVYALLHLVIIPGMHIAPMPETEEYSIPLQQVARVAAGDALTPEQAEAVDGVLVLSELRSAYNGELSDPVKNLWRTDATEDEKAAFWRAWLDIVKDNPATCLSATFHNTYAYLYPGYVSTIKPTLIIGNHSTRPASVKGYFDYTVNPLSTPLKAFTDTLLVNPLYRVLVSPGLYGWLTLLCTAVLLGTKDGILKGKALERDSKGQRPLAAGGFVCAIPALFTLVGCLFSAVNGYFRYAMPLYLCTPFLLWLISNHEGGKSHEPKV